MGMPLQSRQEFVISHPPKPNLAIVAACRKQSAIRAEGKVANMVGNRQRSDRFSRLGIHDDDAVKRPARDRFSGGIVIHTENERPSEAVSAAAPGWAAYRVCSN